MNIDEYMCNMKVLVGLVIANSIGLNVFLTKSTVTDKIDISDKTNQLVHFNYTIFTGFINDINTYIVYNGESIYLPSLVVGHTLEVFLR